MAGYWADRNLRIQDAIADKTIEEIEAQLAKYYESTAKRLTKDFEATYNKIMAKKAEGKNPTPADLYKLDKYWQLMAQLSKEGERLGNKQIALMEKAFKEEWEEIYEKTSLPSDLEFATLSTDGARAMVDTVWLADGKTFSERVWGNVNNLVTTLNDELIHCVAAGKKTMELSDKLQERFNVSRGRANTLVRTEVAHIQTESAKQRYEDAGLTHYEFLGREEHDIGCQCKKLNGKIFSYKEYDVGHNAPPLHPNCRCAIAPVVDADLIKETKMEDKESLKQEMDSLIQEIEEYKRRKWNGNYDNLEEVKSMPPEKQKNWLGRCKKCGEAFLKESDKAHNQKYCPFCQDELRHIHDIDKNLNAMYARRMAKGMSHDEALNDMERFWERKEDGETNLPYIKKGRKKAESKKSKAKRESTTPITKYCYGCGKKMTLTYGEHDRWYCDECEKKNETRISWDGHGMHCRNCGKPASRRDREQKNGNIHLCVKCRRDILNSEYGKYHKNKGFKDIDILKSYVNAENPLEFKMEIPKGMYKEGYINQEKKYSQPSQKLLKSVENLTDADFGFCSECGKYYIKENRKATRQLRCPECQEKHDKEYKRQKAQEYRDKSKAEREAAKAAEEAKEARKRYKAEWARKNRANKKAMKAPK